MFHRFLSLAVFVRVQTVGCAVITLGLGLAAAPQKDSKDVPPKLVATEGGTNRDAPWSTIAELTAAADKGDPQACFLYAQLLEEGSEPNKIAKNESKAVELYQRAAAKQHAPALFRLGKIYSDGLLGVPADPAKSFGYFERAARNGSPEGKFNVGAMLVSGRGVKRDYVEGLAWLTLAAKSGTGQDAVQQVRNRLAKRPEDITKAEQRAAALEVELSRQPKPADDRTAQTGSTSNPN